MPSHTPTPELTPVPEPPPARTSLRRRVAVYLRDMVVGGLIAGTVFTALGAAVPASPSSLDRPPCFPKPLSPAAAEAARRDVLLTFITVAAVMKEVEIRARLREIVALHEAEAAMRATLPRSRPGLYVPNNLEEYR